MYGGGGNTYGGGSTYGEPGASQFAGGGFMPSPGGAGGGGDNAGTNFSPGTSKRPAGSNALIPLTVKQLSNAVAKSPGDENLIIDGQEVNNVTLLGRVLQREEKTTDITFKLDDGTGVLEVKKWNDGEGNGDNAENELIQVGNYVRVYGHHRSFQGKRLIVAFAIRPITDFNEVTFHYLECIFGHMVNSKGIASGAQPPATQSFEAYGNTSHTVGGSSMPYTAGNQYAAPSSAAGADATSELQKRIQSIFEDPSNRQREEGLSLATVHSRIPGYSLQQIKDQVYFLVEEGHLYSTIDDNHYKSTSA